MLNSSFGTEHNEHWPSYDLVAAEAEGKLVSRSELIGASWPGEVEGNFDRWLDKAVAKSA